MKIFKSLTFAVLLIFGLSGCYTQLQYSEKMKRVTDREPVEEYSWDGEERAHANTGEYEGDAGVVSDYVPPYKDYETEQFYNQCKCAYSDYREGYLNGVDDALTALKYDYSPSYFRFSVGSYFPYYHFGYNYTHSPFYSSYFHNRWFHPYRYSPFYYHSFYYGYGPYYGFNYYRFYNGGGYYYGYNDRKVRDNRRYGPRSTGGSRVSSDDGTRTRSGTASDIRSRTRSSQSEVRTRSNNGSQSRGTVDRSRSRTRDNGNVGQSRTRSGNGSGAVQRTRSRGNSNDGSRTRGGSSVSSKDGNDEYRSRVGIMQNRYSRSVRDIRSEVNRRSALENARERYLQQNRRVSGGSFWERLNKALSSPDSRNALRSRINSNDNNFLKSLRSRSNNSNSTRSRSIQRSRNDNRSSGSSVDRSRSKSSDSGSRSRSRSRSGGNDDDRSRSRSGGN